MIKTVKNIITKIINVVAIIICGFFEAVCKVTIINVFVLLSLFNLVRVTVTVENIQEDK